MLETRIVKCGQRGITHPQLGCMKGQGGKIVTYLGGLQQGESRSEQILI